MKSRHLGVVAFALFVSSVVFGQGSVDPYFGSFGTTVPISVPGFRGLEPDIQLAYNSGARNGPMGVGWSFGGFSRIDRP